MFKISPLRKRQFFGVILGLLIGSSIFTFLTIGPSEEYISLGPMNSGHGDISCATCHADAKGNLSQQIQSNISHLFGARKNGVDFGTQDVSAENCLQCHDRPNDRHPTYRFSEPRFADVIEQINTTTCITCHSEHHGERVTISPVNYCMNCHQDLIVEDDPLDISHKQLIANKEWFTCIQCHDFHGNHRYEVAEKLKDTIPMKKILVYLKGGQDPYGTDKKYIGLSEPEWLKQFGSEK
ncbi:MAG: cytochrome c3 family protein [Flavobacteriaceae bacterium]